MCDFYLKQTIYNIFVQYIYKCQYCGFEAHLYKNTSGYDEKIIYYGQICQAIRVPKG